MLPFANNTLVPVTFDTTNPVEVTFPLKLAVVPLSSPLKEAEDAVKAPIVVLPNLVVPVELIFPAVNEPVTVNELLKVSLVPDNNPFMFADVAVNVPIVEVLAVKFPIFTKSFAFKFTA